MTARNELCESSCVGPCGQQRVGWKPQPEKWNKLSGVYNRPPVLKLMTHSLANAMTNHNWNRRTAGGHCLVNRIVKGMLNLNI